MMGFLTGVSVNILLGQLPDLTGVDVLLHATKNIYNDTADEKFFPPELLARMVTAGDLGRKTGRGFYTY